jgi:hypothetical protein
MEKQMISASVEHTLNHRFKLDKVNLEKRQLGDLADSPRSHEDVHCDTRPCTGYLKLSTAELFLFTADCEADQLFEQTPTHPPTSSSHQSTRHSCNQAA